MTTPNEAAKGLSGPMQRAICYSTALVGDRTLDALARRGLVHEGTRKMTPLGECVRTLLRGHDPEGLSDADRIALRNERDGTAFGPAEWDPCDRHPGHGMVTRWVWGIPEDGDHEDAIGSSDPEIIQGCPLCNAEDEARWKEECE